MQTEHKIIISDSRRMEMIEDESVNLVITSPPYPMIKMWDALFSSFSPEIHSALERNDSDYAFESMHSELDKVWNEVYRVLKPGSVACINIGDAVRSVDNNFKLYPNHARVISACRNIGFECLPVILWRKPTNAPNKFMGSGMLPSAAYVTLEHEYILILRKGGKRKFNTDVEKTKRMKSAFFWEERNKWFSDIWEIKGTSQNLAFTDLRKRSAAFPIDLCYRLINMYSIYEDLVLDPFSGTGTTNLACIVCGRNSIGVELDESFKRLFAEQVKSFLPEANSMLSGRISRHIEFIDQYEKSAGKAAYINKPYGFKVITRQEKEIEFYKLSDISIQNGLQDLHLNVMYSRY